MNIEFRTPDSNSEFATNHGSTVGDLELELSSESGEQQQVIRNHHSSR